MFFLRLPLNNDILVRDNIIHLFCMSMTEEKKFNPREYNEIAEMPEEQRAKFKSVEGGFVYTSAEVDPELAQNLAGLHESALSVLHERVTETSADLDSFIQNYDRLKSDYSKYEEQGEALQRLLEVYDDALIRGVEPDARLAAALKANHRDSSYSDRLQDHLAKNADPDNAELCARLIQDSRMMSFRLFKQIKTDDQRRAIVGHLLDQPSKFAETVGEVHDLPLAIDLLKNLLDHGRSKPENEKKGYSDGYQLERLREKLCEKIIDAGDLETLEALLREQYLKSGDAKRAFAKATNDRALELVSYYMTRPEQAATFGKFMAEPEVIDRLAKAPADAFHFLTPEQSVRAQTEFTLFSAALQQPLDIEPIGTLATDHTQNKFVVGLDPVAKRWSLAWSNVKDREYHKDIFTDLERTRGTKYPKEYRSGGAVQVDTTPEGQTVARLWFSSGDFGTYNRRLLERSHQEITEAIRTALGRADIEVVIEISG